MSKKQILLIIGILVLAIAFVGLFFYVKGVNNKPGITSESDDLAETVETIRTASVMITAGNYHGSGVIVGLNEDELTIVTVAHLMKGYDQGIVTFSNGKVGFGDVTVYDEDKDLCLMTLNRNDMAEGFTEGLSVACIDPNRLDTVLEKEQVYVVGSAVGSGMNITIGTVADKDYFVPEFEMKMLYLYADVFEGMSGSGCFDSEGYLLGLVAGGTESSEAVCIKLGDVVSIIED